MSIPGGICCPNGELALRIRDIAPDPKTRIVVNCAGRTRSIIGAQTLIDFGVPNPVLALENGTQGWFLAGLALEQWRDAALSESVGHAEVAELAARARVLAESTASPTSRRPPPHGWLCDASRTTYFLDVRTAEEVAANGHPGLRARPRRPAHTGDRSVGRQSKARGSCSSTMSSCARRWSPPGCASLVMTLACLPAASWPRARISGAGEGRPICPSCEWSRRARPDRRLRTAPSRRSTCAPA